MTMLGTSLRRAALATAVAFAACHQLDPVAETAAGLCNGVDDDGNGIVDDLDVNGDGLCDCLRIGTSGYPNGPLDQIRAWMGTRASRTVLLAGEVLTPELLARLDVLVVQDVRDGVDGGTAGEAGPGLGIGRAFSDAEVQAVRAWVEAGGGLMTLAGYSTAGAEVTNVNRLLAPFGLSYGTDRILAGASATPVTSWDVAHPIARGVAQVGVNGGFQVAGGSLVASVASPGPYALGRATTFGRGHVFAWGDDAITYDAQWTDPGSQARRLWQNAFAWLTVAGYCQVQPDGATDGQP